MTTEGFRSFSKPYSAAESRAQAAESGRELAELLSPISCEEFVNSCFSRISLAVPGTPQKFDHIFSWERLQKAIMTGQAIPDRRYNITASFTGGEESGSSRRMIEAYHHQIGELLLAGATICITNIHMADPLLARWARAIRSQLNFAGTVGVNCYMSPDGSGLPMHYDKRVATTLQLGGKKRWRFSTQPAKAWPSHNALYQQGRVEPSGVDPGKLPTDLEFEEVELSPGDLLCLPAGAWHSAKAVGDSFAINIYFAPRNFMETLLPLLQNFADANADWRAGPPPTLEKIQGDMPKPTNAYILERLDEFQKLARDVLDGPDALIEPWLGSLTQEPHTGWRATPKSAPQQFTPGQRFRVAAGSLRFIDSGDNVLLPCDHSVLKFPVTATPVLRRLSAEASTFSIDDVLGWRAEPDVPSANEVVTWLHTLRQNGVVEVLS
jgi:hypothetical protein